MKVPSRLFLKAVSQNALEFKKWEHTAATKLSDTLKEPLKTLKEGLNNTANLKEGASGLIWRRLKWIPIVVFENMLAAEITNSFSKFIFDVCNVW